MDEKIRKSQEYMDAVFFIEACSRGEYKNNEEIAKKEGRVVMERLMDKIYEDAKKSTVNECYKIFMDKVKKFSEEFTDMAVIQNIKDNYSGENEREEEPFI